MKKKVIKEVFLQFKKDRFEYFWGGIKLKAQVNIKIQDIKKLNIFYYLNLFKE